MYDLLRPGATVPPRSGRMRRPLGLAVVLTAAFAALSGTAGAVTFDDPAHFSVKRTFTLPAPLPTPISGIRCSTDGNTVYVVGDADIETGGVWGIPVTRDPTTHEVTALGVATKIFGSSDPDSNNPGSGLNAGLEIGPTPGG